MVCAARFDRGPVVPMEEPMSESEKRGRSPGRETEHENLRVPSESGKPPRPATEPPGSEDSTRSPETLTDPGSGEPNPDHEPEAPADH